MQQLIVIANTDADARLARSVAAQARSRAAEVFVVCPALNSWLRRWCSDEDAARQRAAGSLARWLAALRAEGVPSAGQVGDSDAVQAADDARRLIGATEVIVIEPEATAAPAARSTLAGAVGIAACLLALVAATTAISAGAAPAKPRNGKISFWSDRAFRGRAQVFLMNADGSRQRRLTRLFSAKRGDWSPDGRSLVIDGRDRPTDFDFDIFVVDAEGTGLRKVTAGPERDTQATWSPDGRSIAFTRAVSDGGPRSLWIVGADGTGAHRVADGGPAAWSPNGRKLAVGGLALRVMNVDGTGSQTIVAGEAEPAAWSPDGRQILFTSWRDGNTEVYVVSADGDRLRRLTRSSGEDYAADFSPGGRRILFTSDHTGRKQVYVMNLNGIGVRNLTRSRSNDWATSWRAA